MIIDGNKIASKILAEAKEQISLLPSKPSLAIILVGNNPASLIYTKRKEEDCKKIGIDAKRIFFPENISQEELIEKIRQLNNDQTIDAMIVQLPLPSHIDEDFVLQEISPIKDADGLHPQNLGKAILGIGPIFPCTPAGIIYILKESNIGLSGKKAVVIGRSRIVGLPLSFMLLNQNCTVTICHSKTKNLKEHTLSADILCVAVGKPKFITADMVKEDAVVIDVGINREGEKLVGDVDFDLVSKKASAITPVPGGVGPLTRAMLIKNTIECYKLHKKR